MSNKTEQKTLSNKIKYWEKRIKECRFSPIKKEWENHLKMLKDQYKK